ncbi:peptidase [bacterium]|nr:peptidase [bacterium]
MKPLFALLMLCLAVTANAGNSKLELKYEIDVTKIESDSFNVTMTVNGVTSDSIVYQFIATSPGMYAVADAGRFVGSFKAYTASGSELPVSRASTNQYLIRNSKQLAKVSYRVEDTYDTAIQEHLIGPMGGTNIERDNAVINSQMVVGYFKGYQINPMQITFRYPKEWKIATALPEKKGVYYADSFDHLVDSPVLLGKLTEASLKIRGARIDVYCYSEHDIIQADSVLTYIKGIIESADKFLNGLPVNRFVFLFHFRKNTGPVVGALEHNYSSYFYMQENPISQVAPLMTAFAAHEFFHIVTPLNIHSEVIEPYNFETPVPSQHLWLYEGATEWAQMMMRVCGGLINEQQFLGVITQKLKISDGFRKDVSLQELSLGSFGELNSQYQNIYYKGALTAMILDMKLLELSKGKTGLREIIKQLSKKYGPKKTFSEKNFFDEFVAMTYPEITDFFERYVKKAEPLPLKEYLAKGGFNYNAEIRTGQYKADTGKYALTVNGDNQVVFIQVDTTHAINRELGVHDGDVMLKVKYQDQEAVPLVQNVIQLVNSIQIDSTFSIFIKRGDQEKVLTAKAGKKEIIVTHKLESMENPSKEQLEFRKLWLSNR